MLFSSKVTLVAFNPLSNVYGTSEFKLYPAQMKSSMLALAKQSSVDALQSDDVSRAIRNSLSNCLTDTHLHLTVSGLKLKNCGKVRDVYEHDDYLVLVTTDRQSAFDRVLASIPFKGQVLNETSLWWFERTKHITENAVVSSPDKNVTIARKCSVFPVEFIVRGYITGSTDTSLWTVYKNGVRDYCGNSLPDGLLKNQKLDANMMTPTTKAADHDVPISLDEIIEKGLMTREDVEEVSAKAMRLFQYGQVLFAPETIFTRKTLAHHSAKLQREASDHGLILVDTKYEFGKDSSGSIVLLDEVHTPDSSRYWIARTYEERFKSGIEPENVDKEFLRLWFSRHCDPYNDEILPAAPEELVCELSRRYIFLYETITNSKFEISASEEPIHDRISRNVQRALVR